ncbi:hypothetical protein ACFVYC_17705 [Pseudarthrobacter sp. NPDC058329]|uniref:hypothetical protein n=1 Tax=Pseudarthrobacter sp. NPDC058329 TaxID=3346448 RepID=UPI0036DA828C
MGTNAVVVEAEEAVDAAVAAFIAALDVLAGVGRSEAKLAAVKALAVAVLAGAAKALNGPASSPYEVTAQDRSLVAEVGCALAIGDRAAGSLLAEPHALTTSLSRTLAALQSGTISWAHARTVLDQTVSLDRAGAAALEAEKLGSAKVQADLVLQHLYVPEYFDASSNRLV